MNKCLPMGIFIWACLCISSFSVADEAKKLKQAKECTKLEQKIQRLTCFDDVFSTPIYGIKYYTNKPKTWIQVIRSERKRKAGHAPLLTVSEKSSDVWVTMPAINREKEKAPLLVLSCIGGISRVELALHQPVKEGRVKIAIGSNRTDLWRSDDTGFLLSAARGTAAMKHIRNLLLLNEVTVRSSNPAINGLKFSAANLKAIVSPIHERCDW